MDRRLNLAKVRAWIPQGRWTDIFTGRIYDGGRWLELYRDLDTIPVLAPAGSIVPMYRHWESNDLSLSQPLEIHIWRGNGSFSLYEDDGRTQSFRRGCSALITMGVREEGEDLRFTISAPAGDNSILPPERWLYIRFRDVVRGEVFVDGSPVTVAEGECLEVPVLYRNRPVGIELRRCQWMKNIPLEQASGDLLTRVQCANGLKSRFFANGGKKMPKYIKNALQELVHLDYTIK